MSYFPGYGGINSTEFSVTADGTGVAVLPQSVVMNRGSVYEVYVAVNDSSATPITSGKAFAGFTVVPHGTDRSVQFMDIRIDKLTTSSITMDSFTLDPDYGDSVTLALNDLVPNVNYDVSIITVNP